MDVWPLAGAPSRVEASDTAFGRRPPYLVAFESSWTDPRDTDANIAWARAAYQSMRGFSGSGVYLNFPGFGEEEEELVRAAYGANYDRLARLKATWDPQNLFRMNQNIPPASGWAGWTASVAGRHAKTRAGISGRPFPVS